MVAYLLMASKGHLPGRKGDEQHPFGCQQVFEGTEQLLLVGNVFDDVVHHDDVEPFLYRWGILEDVGCQESALCIGLTEEAACFLDSPGCQVDACDVAAGLGEWQ